MARAIALDGLPVTVESIQVLDAPKGSTLIVYWPVSDGEPSRLQLYTLEQAFKDYRVVLLPSTARIEVLRCDEKE